VWYCTTGDIRHRTHGEKHLPCQRLQRTAWVAKVGPQDSTDTGDLLSYRHALYRVGLCHSFNKMGPPADSVPQASIVWAQTRAGWPPWAHTLAPRLWCLVPAACCPGDVTVASSLWSVSPDVQLPTAGYQDASTNIFRNLSFSNVVHQKGPATRA
jgi:hypothetical protein